MSEWISVEDRIPPDLTPVWCSVNENILGIFEIVDVGEGWLWADVYSFYHDKGMWESESELNDDYSHITHWMPLPEPPEA